MNQWRVDRMDRNWKRVVRSCFVRAETEQQARRIGAAVLGGRALTVSQYQPWLDHAFVGYVEEAVT